MGAELIIIMAVLIGAFVIATCVSVGWIFWSVAKGTTRAVFGSLSGAGGAPKAPRLGATNAQRCRRHGCGADNPREARFCRRCGTPLTFARSAGVRKAAMW
jgi:hypothetical protein